MPPTDTEFSYGTRVGLLADPSRHGTATGKCQRIGSLVKVQVRWDDGSIDYRAIGSLHRLEDEVVSDEDEFDRLARLRFSPLSQLRLVLTHQRLTGRLANLIYSLDSTNTEFFPHQFKPVLALLETPGKGVLVADEVGLGKTIEAGLCWTELRSRYGSKRLLVVCKSVLIPKWIFEFKDKFGLYAKEARPESLRRNLEQARKDPAHEFLLVGSYEGLRPRSSDYDDLRGEGARTTERARLLKLLDECEDSALIDLTVFDECQYMRNDETAAHDLGARITAASEHVLMLSATPINNSVDDLFNLLNLLDPGMFRYRDTFHELIRDNHHLVRLRDDVLANRVAAASVRERIQDLLSIPRFASSQQLRHLATEVGEGPPGEEQEWRAGIALQLERINLLGKVFTRTRKREVARSHVPRVAVDRRISMTDLEAAVYGAVSSTLRAYADRHGLLAGFIACTPQLQMSSSIAAAVEFWQGNLNEGGERTIDDVEELEDLFDYEVDDEEVQQARPLFALVRSVIARLGDLSGLRSADSKYLALRDDLIAYVRAHPGSKIILFSFFKATLRYLSSRLEEDGIGTLIVHGGLDKQRLLEQFRTDPSILVLLASEVASEGVDLQFSSLLINYDLPWNPMRIEQRIGRIDRIGQRAPSILIWNFFHEGTIDDRVYMKLFAKLEIFKSALGGLEEVLGTRFEDIGRRALVHDLTDAEIDELLKQNVQAIANVNRLEKDLADTAAVLTAHRDYVLNSINEARAFQRYIRTEDLKLYVLEYLRTAFAGTHIRPLDERAGRYRLQLPEAAVQELRAFWGAERIRQSSRLLSHAHAAPDVVFVNKAGLQFDGAECVSQFHPLVRFIAKRLESSTEFKTKCVVAGRLSASDSIPAGRYLVWIQRFEYVTESRRRIIERLHFAGRLLSGDPVDSGFAERIVGELLARGSDWIDAAVALDGARCVDPAVRALDDTENAFADELLRMNREQSDRTETQLQSLAQYTQSKQLRFDEVISRHRDARRLGLMRAEEAKRAALMRTLEARHHAIEAERNVTGSHRFVAMALIDACHHA